MSKTPRNTNIVKIYTSEPSDLPGQMQLTMIGTVASFDACCFDRWIHAAFDGPYEKVPDPGAARPPSEPEVGSLVIRPATDAMLITREGISALVPFFKRSSSLITMSIRITSIEWHQLTQPRLLNVNYLDRISMTGLTYYKTLT